MRGIVFVVFLAFLALHASAQAPARDGLPSRVGTSISDEARVQHAAAVASTEAAARLLGASVAIESARRIAPFDLTWGTP